MAERLGGSRLFLLAIAVLLIIGLGAWTGPTTASARKCLPSCVPPPEEESGEHGEEKPPPPLPKMLVVNLGWDSGTAATSVPLSPAMLSEATAYLRGPVNTWFKTASPAFREWAVYSGGSFSIPPPDQSGCTGLATGQGPFAREVFASGDAAAQAHGFDLSSYDVVVYVWSRRVCLFDGITNERYGKRIGLEGSLVAARHELGHHLGLPHANALVCENADGTPALPLTGSCHVSESGDPFDTMGGRLVNFNDATYEGMFNASFENALEWLSGQVVNVEAGDFSQTWNLKPLSEIGKSPRALRLVDGQTTLWIEYRQPTGIDQQLLPGLTYGLLIHREVSPGSGIRSSELLDMSPETPNDDPGLRVGQTWANPVGEMKITLNSASGSATVTLSSRRLTVPEVRGLPLAEAEARITAAGLTPTGGGQVNDPTCAYIGVVATQTPFPDSRVLPGTTVNLAVGVKDPDHECV